MNAMVETSATRLTIDGLPVAARARPASGDALGKAQGQALALDPPADEAATIGGLIATNASGPLRFSAGTARDLVIGTRVANPDGTLTRAGGRVVKNVAGYDLNKLHIGSLGALGVIVELSFKLAPLPPASGTVVGRFGDLRAARELLAAVLHSPPSPLAI